MPTCPHTLAKRTISEECCICDECECAFEPGEAAYGCRQCDYDQCLACRRKPCQHNLTKRSHTHGWICDECECEFKRGDSAFGCHHCDYDQCLPCRADMKSPGCCLLMKNGVKEKSVGSFVAKFAHGPRHHFHHFVRKDFLGQSRDVAEKVLAMGLVMAGEAVLRSCGVAGPNQTKCNAAVQAFFNAGGALSGEQFKELSRKMRMMLAQAKCNPTRLEAFSEQKWPLADNVFGYTYKKDQQGDRTLYIGPLFFDQHLIDRANTIVHEMSHACQGTSDHKPYGLPAVRVKPYAEASDNADSWGYFCAAAFSSFHCKLGNEIVEVPESDTTDGGSVEGPRMHWTEVERPLLMHIPDWYQTHANATFTVCLLGDLMGKDNVEFHSIYEYWTVSADGTVAVLIPAQPPDASGKRRFASDTRASPYRITFSGNAFTELTDGLNNLRIVMAGNAGFGFCACGGVGGRSFVSIAPGRLEIVNGRR